MFISNVYKLGLTVMRGRRGLLPAPHSGRGRSEAEVHAHEEVAAEHIEEARQGVCLFGLPASLALPTDAKQLIEYARQPADGTKPRIAAWEQRGRELAFYWRGFQPNEVVSLPIDLVAMVPGRTKGQAMRSYLFYSPDIKFWQNGLQITVKPKS